jgi:hypothetical protein
MVRSVVSGEMLFIGENLNDHVDTSGFEGMHEGFGYGYGIRNQEGEDVLSFALAYDMIVANILFKKRESHPMTFSSGQDCSQLHFISSRREESRACLYRKVIPEESVVHQHKLVMTDLRY